MTVFTRRYYPTLCLRRGEMLALEKLPDETKESILPIILLAPWVNSIKFENTFKIIKKSYGDLPIIVDIDRYYKSENLLESRTYFWSLKDSIDGPQRWMDLVESHPNYIPCIQMAGISEELVIKQVEWARHLGRGFCLRYEIDRFEVPTFNSSLIKYVSNDDYIIVVDFGYHDYSDSVLDKISTVLTEIFDVSASAKVVVTGSNFPNDFEEFDDFARSQPNSAREIYSKILQRFGNYSVFYGDWASAKPRDYDGRGSPPRPRVDYPTSNSWIFARSKDEEWNFQDAATRITRLPEWEQRPKIWGTGMIEKAAMGLPGGIKNHPDVIASRINIHLFVQAGADGAMHPPQPVSKWKDPI